MTISNLNFNTGTLLRWNDDKGYGFIEHKEHRNGIFVHITAFEYPERKPVVGDTVLYQLVVGKENKLQATDAYIKGVKRLQKIMKPKQQNNKEQLSTRDSFKKPKRKYRSTIIERNDSSSVIEQVKVGAIGILILATIIVIWITCYNSYKSIVVSPPSARSKTLRFIHDFGNPNNFKCDGRIYCTQMNSRAEARFFDKYCDGTKMRSTPGEPCKNDSRW